MFYNPLLHVYNSLLNLHAVPECLIQTTNLISLIDFSDRLIMPFSVVLAKRRNKWRECDCLRGAETYGLSELISAAEDRAQRRCVFLSLLLSFQTETPRAGWKSLVKARPPGAR